MVFINISKPLQIINDIQVFRYFIIVHEWRKSILQYFLVNT